MLWADPPVWDALNVASIFDKALKRAIRRVKRANRWHLVSPLCRAFVRAYLIMRPVVVRSIQLMKAVIRALKELREVLSRRIQLLKLGIMRAWRACEIASSWGHPRAKEWINNENFILYHGMLAKWLSRLVGRAILDDP